MGLGRRKIRLEDQAAWVFNKMADAYSARPAYPAALLDALLERVLKISARPRVLDLGAGIGHLALPLAERGCEVVALEPAAKMLDVLSKRATAAGLSLSPVHGTAEALPFGDQSFDLVIIADSLHFLDAELTGGEVARVLAPQGTLALVTCEFADTPFMRGVVQTMERAAPRRPRDVSNNAVQLFRTAGVDTLRELRIHDEQPVDVETLERIFGSISFIGPAMNEARFSAFMREIRALPDTPAWARTFNVRLGAKRRS